MRGARDSPEGHRLDTTASATRSRGLHSACEARTQGSRGALRNSPRPRHEGQAGGRPTRVPRQPESRWLATSRRRCGSSAGPPPVASMPVVAAYSLVAAAVASSWSPEPLLDMLIFGNQTSEAAHQLDASGMDAASPGRGGTCRSPCQNAATCRSGWPTSQPSVTFRMKVDPAKQSYLTVKFDGSAVSVSFRQPAAHTYVLGSSLSHLIVRCCRAQRW